LAKHKKKKPGRAPSSEGEDDFKLPATPNRISRPFADALQGMKVEKPPAKQPPKPAPVKRAPPPPTSADTKKREYEERLAREAAYAGVTRLDEREVRARPARVVVPPEPDPEEAVARSRLDELVARGIRFDVERSADHVRGERTGSNGAAMASLREGRAAPEAELDLHGFGEAKAVEVLVRFLRDARRDRKRVVLVIHGIGHHSQGGTGILRDAVVDAITGSAATYVLAFVTAEQRRGGAGALLVRLDG
jgi:DNA-nicking Smr family endonuclease